MTEERKRETATPPPEDVDYYPWEGDHRAICECGEPCPDRCTMCTQCADKSHSVAEAKIAREKADPYKVSKIDAKIEVKKAYSAARQTLLKDYFLDQLKDPENTFLKELPSELAEILLAQATKAQEKAAKKKTAEWFLMTVNSKNGTDVAPFVARVLKVAQRSQVQYSRTAFEVTRNPGRGPHAHVLLHLTEPMAQSTLRNLMWESLKHFCLANGKNDSNVLNVKPLPTDADVDRAADYIDGDKASPDKRQEIEEFVIPWREQWGLDDVYEWERQEETAN